MWYVLYKESRIRVARIKESLLSCKSLLHCKRDELRKFWLDGLEQNTISTMLEDVLVSEIIHNEMWQYAHLLATRLKRVEGSRPLSAAWAIDNLYEATVN